MRRLRDLWLWTGLC